jgi:NAD(P)-dependent dehydrogenase (short-subunit alcohol dehydrogenase family)
VVLLDTDDRGKELLNDDRAFFIRCDVSRNDEVQRAFERARVVFEPPDILVNNAGIQHYGTVTSTPEEEWDRVMAVNLKSAYLCAKYALPGIQEKGAGLVINMASVQSFHSQPNVAPYTTSKAALLGLTRSIAVDFAPEIRCVAVCPGTVDTPMVQWTAEQTGDAEALYEEVAQMHLLKRIGKPDEVAGLIAYLCSEEASFFTGQAIRIDGGLGVALGGSVKANES